MYFCFLIKKLLKNILKKYIKEKCKGSPAKSIMRKQSRKVEGIIMFFCLAITISRGLWLCGDAPKSYLIHYRTFYIVDLNA